MNGLLHALQAELIKIWHSRIVWVTFVAFALAPLMGAVLMLMLRNPEAMATSGALSTKAQLMGFSANWEAYLELLKQAMGVGGILVFGFVASWMFGREYADGTAKDLLALPTSRAKILNAKFILYMLWCFALAISNLLLALLLGALLQLPAPPQSVVAAFLQEYFLTTCFTMLLGTPVAFFALWGKGYLAPLGIVALTLVFAQVIAATGYGAYFPWSVPGLYSGAGGAYKAQLNVWSYTILIINSIVGYIGALGYWIYADHTE